MDIMFILHAEHEMNCSTAAARHLASSGVDVYTAISGRPSLTVYVLLVITEHILTLEQRQRSLIMLKVCCSDMSS